MKSISPISIDTALPQKRRLRLVISGCWTDWIYLLGINPLTVHFEKSTGLFLSVKNWGIGHFQKIKYICFHGYRKRLTGANRCWHGTGKRRSCPCRFCLTISPWLLLPVITFSEHLDCLFLSIHFEMKALSLFSFPFTRYKKRTFKGPFPCCPWEISSTSNISSFEEKQ